MAAGDPGRRRHRCQLYILFDVAASGNDQMGHTTQPHEALAALLKSRLNRLLASSRRIASAQLQDERAGPPAVKMVRAQAVTLALRIGSGCGVARRGILRNFLCLSRLQGCVERWSDPALGVLTFFPSRAILLIVGPWFAVRRP
jgi:hypothetical protein